MGTITDHDQIIKGLREQLEASEYEREQQSITISEHVEALGHEGNDADALRDALGQIERLLDGKDLTDDFEGVAGRVAASVQLNVTISTLFATAFADCIVTVSSSLQTALAALAEIDVKKLKQSLGALRKTDDGT